MKNLLLLFIATSLAMTGLAQNTKATDTVSTNFSPVLRSYVAPDVVYRAQKKYGRSLYCIEKTLASNCENSYLVGLIRNGKLTMEWMCDDPKMVMLSSRKQFLH